VLKQPRRPTAEAPNADYLSSRGGGGIAGPTPEATATPAPQNLYAELDSFTLTHDPFDACSDTRSNGRSNCRRGQYLAWQYIFEPEEGEKAAA
jgi:hypothetical protein